MNFTTAAVKFISTAAGHRDMTCAAHAILHRGDGWQVAGVALIVMLEKRGGQPLADTHDLCIQCGEFDGFGFEQAACFVQLLKLAQGLNEVESIGHGDWSGGLSNW